MYEGLCIHSLTLSIMTLCVCSFLFIAGGWKHDEDDAAQIEGGGEGSDEKFLWDSQSHTRWKQNNSHIIVAFLLMISRMRHICFLQWKMRILIWTSQKTKVQTATWKSVDLLSHGPFETASWQVYRQGIAMFLLWWRWKLFWLLSNST